MLFAMMGQGLDSTTTTITNTRYKKWSQGGKIQAKAFTTQKKKQEKFSHLAFYIIQCVSLTGNSLWIVYEDAQIASDNNKCNNEYCIHSILEVHLGKLWAWFQKFCWDDIGRYPIVSGVPPRSTT